MSQFYFHATTASEPKPNASQSSQTVYFGTYQGPFESNLTAGTASAATNKSQAFGAGVDDYFHDSDSIQWITFPLVNSATGSGTWKADLWLDVSAVPLSNQVKLTAGIYKWNANDTLNNRIGNVQTTATDLTTTVTQYTLTFATTTTDTPADGDKYLIDMYFTATDAVSLGDNGVYTLRIRYDSATRPSSMTFPGTQTQLSTLKLLPLTGVGV